MKNKNSLKCVALLMGGIFAASPAVLDACAFNAAAHKYVTKTGIEIIQKVNGDLKDDNTERDAFFNKDYEKYKRLIEEYSNKPDEDETEGAYKYHFYNPINGRNYMGEKNSALTKCTSHFDDSVSYYKKGNKNLAYQELGRSLHFMEDLNTPVHTGYQLPSDAVVKFPLHVKFEKVCDSILSECYSDLTPESLKYYNDNSVKTIAKAGSVLSGDNFYCLENLKEIESKKLARNAVTNAQKKAAGLFYKFFQSVID